MSAFPLLAYIDPGTGSALFYVVASIVVSAAYGARAAYYRLTESFGRRRASPVHCNLAIHSEDPRYELTFLPVLRALAERGIETTYFTMYARDDSFEPLPPGILHRPIPEGLLGYSVLNQLEAKVLVTTTPQLDVMTFRRSKRVGHYCYVTHALGEARYLRPYAYDFFDSILCCGPILADNVRKLEAIRNFPAKLLLPTGVPHYDELLTRKRARVVEATHPDATRPTVLVAPSWGPLSLFRRYGVDFIGTLTDHFTVVVRPHPQLRISEPELFARVLSLEGVEVDTTRTPENALSRADVLVSDISGISHEFAFIYERPVIVVDQHGIEGGLEGELLGGDSELKERCRDIIVPIPPSDLGQLDQVVARVLEDFRPERLVAVRNEVVHNFGAAGQAAAEHIASLLDAEGSSTAPAALRQRNSLITQRAPR